MLVAPTGAHAIFTTFEGGGPRLEMPSGDVLAWPPKVVNLEMQPIFNQTAGNFRVVYPHQYNQFLLQLRSSTRTPRVVLRASTSGRGLYHH